MRISEEQIRRRSYEIWQRQGCPHHLAEEHWFQALAELTAEFPGAPSAAGTNCQAVWPRPVISYPPTKSKAARRADDEDFEARPPPISDLEKRAR